MQLTDLPREAQKAGCIKPAVLLGGKAAACPFAAAGGLVDGLVHDAHRQFSL
jgi:hypothetical protein